MGDLKAEFAALYKESGLGQESVAAQLRLSRPTIGRYLNGQLMPKQVTVDALRRIVEIERARAAGEPVAPRITLREEEVPYVTALRRLGPDQRKVVMDVARTLGGEPSSKPGSVAEAATFEVSGAAAKRALKREAGGPSVRKSRRVGGAQGG